MKEDIEILYEMWLDAWHELNLFGKIMIVISLPLYLLFSTSVLVIGRVMPPIVDAFDWFFSLMKK